MKYTRQILMTLCCIFFTVNVIAKNVTQENATNVAKNFFSEVYTLNGINHSEIISELFEIKKDGNTVYYVFNFEEGGYVIVSAEDCFTPVIGYSPDGYYDKDNLPCCFKDLMEGFADMIVFIRENNVAPTQEYSEKWKRYSDENMIPNRGFIAPVVGPLTALWNQDNPYNYYAPIDEKANAKAPAGCVATAMSMIMYYWRWPWQGDGERSYQPTTCTHGTVYPILSANFGEAFYDYNGMYGTPTIKSDNYLYEPIALLQYHTAIAVNMNYCKNGSGAQSAVVPEKMRTHFKYSPSIVQRLRQNYPNTEAWADLIKEQLDLKQPVYASGRDPNTNGGHAYTCDGYDNNNPPMFHYNFGWSGSSNGYFVADKPGKYTTQNTVIINFIPDRTKGYPIDCNGNWTLSYQKGMIADCSGPADNYSKGVTATWLIDPTLVGQEAENITVSCVEFDLASGDYLKIFDGESDLYPLLGEFSGSELFNKVTSTQGKIFIQFTSSTSSATAQGFLIAYEAKPKNYCPTVVKFTEPSGIFTDGSPEEMNYASSTSCRWDIHPEGAEDPETTITFNFTRLDTEEGTDVIKFYNGETNKMIETISGVFTSDFPQVTIKARKATVFFNSNTYINGKGFEIEYATTPVSIKEVENINNLTVYPNPASDKLNIKFNTTITDDLSITIHNITGQTVFKESLNNYIGSYHNELNVNDFAQGIYLIKIQSSKGTFTQKLVIQ